MAAVVRSASATINAHVSDEKPLDDSSCRPMVSVDQALREKRRTSASSSEELLDSSSDSSDEDPESSASRE